MLHRTIGNVISASFPGLIRGRDAIAHQRMGHDMSDTAFTTQTIQQNFAKAMGPVADAMKSASIKLQVPEAARDFVKRSAELAKDRAASVHAGSIKATDAVESAASRAVTGFAQLSRDWQVAAHDDATAYFTSLGKIAGAKSMGEAAQLQAEYLRERAAVNAGRAKAAMGFLTSALSEGAKKAQEGMSTAASFGKAA